MPHVQILVSTLKEIALQSKFGRKGILSGEKGVLASSGSFQVLYTLLEAPHLLFDNPELDIESLVQFNVSLGDG
jgi:hypothetical protein